MRSSRSSSALRAVLVAIAPSLAASACAGSSSSLASDAADESDGSARADADGAPDSGVRADSAADGAGTADAGDAARGDADAPAPATGFGLLPSGLRDKTKWPFASDSIWNTPIGTGAVYVSAGTKVNTASGYPTRFGQDQDVIVMKPTAPRVDVSLNNVGWSGGDRCPVEGKVLQSAAPIPSSLVIPSGSGNNSAAILSADGHTLLQNQPLTRCVAGGPATALVTAADQDIYGPGIAGAHGGSGMSAVGGTLRFGELSSGAIHHALKINLWAKQFYHCCTPHWPATTVDGYANATTYGGSNPDVGPGSLLALKPTFDVSGLRTVPARILAQALVDYGAYLVDDSYWNDWDLCTEQGPDGRVVDEFQSLFKTKMSPGDTDPFKLDLDQIFDALQVVQNNAAKSVGGGGTPRVALAPAIGN